MLCSVLYNNNEIKLNDTPLHLASLEGYNSVVDCLFKSGADVNAFNNVSLVLLHHQAYSHIVHV